MSVEYAEQSLQEVQQFIMSASEFCNASNNPREFRNVFQESTTPETKALVTQVSDPWPFKNRFDAFNAVKFEFRQRSFIQSDWIDANCGKEKNAQIHRESKQDNSIPFRFFWLSFDIYTN